MAQEVTWVMLPYVSTARGFDGQWSAQLVPTGSASHASAEGYGGEWVGHLRDGSWTLADGAVLIDYRGDDAVWGIGTLPMADHAVPRNNVRRAFTGGMWTNATVYAAIDWSREDFGCGSIDDVHPLDYVRMLGLRGVRVTPLEDVVNGGA